MTHRVDRVPHDAQDVEAREDRLLKGTQKRGDYGHLMLGDHNLKQSEVIRAILLKDSPCCGVPAPSGRHCARSRPARCTGLAPGWPPRPPRTGPATIGVKGTVLEQESLPFLDVLLLHDHQSHPVNKLCLSQLRSRFATHTHAVRAIGAIGVRGTVLEQESLPVLDVLLSQ